MLENAQKTVTMFVVEQININDDGTPQSLLNIDWQKNYQHEFELNETIYVEQDIEKQTPILKALTPPIVASTNQPLPIEAFEQLLLMFKVSVEDTPVATLADVLPALTADSLAHLADELWLDYRFDIATFGDFHKRGSDTISTEKAWFIPAFAWMADKTLAKSVWRFLYWNRIDPYVRSCKLHSLEVLVTFAEDLANRRRPTFGLDKHGIKIIDYNPSVANSRKLTVYLTANLEFSYQDESGKTYKTPPKARAMDDSNVVNEFLHQHNLEKEQLKAMATSKLSMSLEQIVSKDQYSLPPMILADFTIYTTAADLPKMLEKMMLSQRTLSISDFMRYYIHDPVISVLAQRLVWQIQSQDKDNGNINNGQTFRIGKSFEWLDAQNTPINRQKFAEHTFIFLVHPIYLSAKDIQQWTNILSGYELVQPFRQLSRPLYWLTDEERSSGTMHRFNDVLFAMSSLIELQSPSKGWNINPDGIGNYCGFYRDQYSLLITLFKSFRLDEHLLTDNQGYGIECIEFSQEIDDLTASELLLDINEMARVS